MWVYSSFVKLCAYICFFVCNNRRLWKIMGEFTREFCACASISLTLPIFLHVRKLDASICFLYASSTTSVIATQNISKGGTTIVANNNH